MNHAPGDILTYRDGGGRAASGRYVAEHGTGKKAVHIVQTRHGRKLISPSEVIPTSCLTRFSCVHGQQVRIVKKNGFVYEGALRSWGELFVTITINEGAVGYMALVEDIEGVYSLEGK
jgi:hypothetical protein